MNNIAFFNPCMIDGTVLRQRRDVSMHEDVSVRLNLCMQREEYESVFVAIACSLGTWFGHGPFKPPKGGV